MKCKLQAFDQSSATLSKRYCKLCTRYFPTQAALKRHMKPRVWNPLKSFVMGLSLLVNCYLEIKFHKINRVNPPPPLKLFQIKDGFSLFHLGGVDKSWGGVICSLITGSLGGASRRLTRLNFFLTLGCLLGATLLTQFKTYYSFHYS